MAPLRTAAALLALVSRRRAAEVIDLYSADDCAYWAHTGQCTENEAFMRTQCAASCARRGEAAGALGDDACGARSRELEARLDEERNRTREAQEQVLKFKALKDAAISVQKKMMTATTVEKASVLSDCETCFASRKNCNQQIADLRRQIEDGLWLQTSSQTKAYEFERLLEQQKLEKSKAQAELQRIHGQLKTKTVELDSTSTAYEKRIRLLQEQYSEIQTQLNEHRTSTSSKQNELNVLVAEMESVRAQSKTLEQELYACKDKAKTMGEEHDVTSRRKQSEMEATSAELQILRMRSSELEKELEASHKSVNAMLEKHGTELQRQREEFQKQATGKQSELEKKQSELEATVAELEIARMHSSEVQKKLLDDHGAELQRQRDELQKDTAGKRSELEKKEHELESAVKELEIARARSSELEKTLEASHKNKNTMLVEHGSQLQSQLDELQKQAAEKQSELARAVSLLESARARSTKLERELEAAQDKVSNGIKELEMRLERQLEEHSAKEIAAAEQIAALEARLAPSESHLSSTALCLIGAVHAVLLIVSCWLWRWSHGSSARCGPEAHHVPIGDRIGPPPTLEPFVSAPQPPMAQAAEDDASQVPGHVGAVVSEVEARIAATSQRHKVPTPFGLTTVPSAPSVACRLADIYTVVARLDAKLDRAADFNKEEPTAPVPGA